MWVHVCYNSLDCFVKPFSYNNLVSLHNMYLFYSKLLLLFTMTQRSLFIFIFVKWVIHDISLILFIWYRHLCYHKLFHNIAISGRTFSPNTANMQFNLHLYPAFYISFSFYVTLHSRHSILYPTTAKIRC